MQVITHYPDTSEVTVRDPTPAEIAAMTPDISIWRASASCTRMQGILAVGEKQWATILQYRDTATWAEQVIIDEAGDWHRTSENIAFFGYLLGLSEVEVDDLFRAANVIRA